MKPWECTMNEGEMIYFPDQWHHATINLEKYTVLVSSFTTEHERRVTIFSENGAILGRRVSQPMKGMKSGTITI